MKRGWLGRGGWAVAVMVALACPGSAWALTDEEVLRDFRFNFINPGARAQGMGGAFIAAADDATAAQTNPAALNYVYFKEIFAEYRQGRSDTAVFAPAQGSFGNLDVSGNGLPFLTLQAVNNRDDTSTPSFASFAYPFRPGGRRLTIGVSRQVALDFTTSLEDGDGPGTTSLRLGTDTFAPWVNPGNLGCTDPNGSYPTPEWYAVCSTARGVLDAELVQYNLAGSIELTKDFSFGMTLTWAQLDMASEVLTTTTDPRGFLVSQHPRVITPGGNSSDLMRRTSIDDSDSGFAWTAGLHWHPDLAFGGYSPIRFGLVYRKGADLSVEETKDHFDPVIVPGGAFVTDQTFETTLRVPDRLGIGFAYLTQPKAHGGAWTFALDVERIEFSDLLEGFRSGVNFFTSDDLTSILIDPTSNMPIIALNNLKFTVDDATVVHAGVQWEYRTEAAWVWAFRGGWFNSPDNRIRLEKISGGTGSTTEQGVIALYKDVFRGGEDDSHFTGGFSIATPHDLIFALAGDFSDAGQEIVGSIIYRFTGGS